MSKHDEEALKQEVKRLSEAVFGDGKKLGMSQQHLIIWRFHVYLLCICSGAVGVAISIVVHRALKVLNP